MIIRLCYILIGLFPAFSFAQSSFGNDLTFEKIVHTDCEGKKFTRVEVLPSLHIPKPAFEDTLTAYLKARNAFVANKKFVFLFLLTNRSEMLDFQQMADNGSNGNAVKEALIKFSRFWLPAKQNGHLVCAYVKCIIEIKNNTLDVQILQ